jgi:hypothetical protein
MTSAIETRLPQSTHLRCCPRCGAARAGPPDGEGRTWFTCVSNYRDGAEFVRGSDCLHEDPPLQPALQKGKTKARQKA